MKNSPMEELQAVGTPIKELAKSPGFQELSAVKDILKPLKELASEKGFDELSKFKDIFQPVKDAPFAEPLIPSGGTEQKSSNEESKGEKKE